MSIVFLLLTLVSYRNMPIQSHLRETDVTETTNKSGMLSLCPESVCLLDAEHSYSLTVIICNLLALCVFKL